MERGFCLQRELASQPPTDPCQDWMKDCQYIPPSRLVAAASRGHASGPLWARDVLAGRSPAPPGKEAANKMRKLCCTIDFNQHDKDSLVTLLLKATTQPARLVPAIRPKRDTQRAVKLRPNAALVASCCGNSHGGSLGFVVMGPAVGSRDCGTMGSTVVGVGPSAPLVHCQLAGPQSLALFGSARQLFHGCHSGRQCERFARVSRHGVIWWWSSTMGPPWRWRKSEGRIGDMRRGHCSRLTLRTSSALFSGATRSRSPCILAPALPPPWPPSVRGMGIRLRAQQPDGSSEPFTVHFQGGCDARICACCSIAAVWAAVAARLRMRHTIRVWLSVDEIVARVALERMLLDTTAWRSAESAQNPQVCYCG